MSQGYEGGDSVPAEYIESNVATKHEVALTDLSDQVLDKATEILDRLKDSPAIASGLKSADAERIKGGYEDCSRFVGAFQSESLSFFEDHQSEGRLSRKVPGPLLARGITDEVRVFRAVTPPQSAEGNAGKPFVTLDGTNYQIEMLIRPRAVNPNGERYTENGVPRSFQKQPRLSVKIKNLETGVVSEMRIDPLVDTERGNIAFDICPDVDSGNYKTIRSNDPASYEVKDRNGISTYYHYDSGIPRSKRLDDGSYLTFPDLMQYFTDRAEEYTTNGRPSEQIAA